MSDLLPFPSFLQSTGRTGQGAICGESQRQSSLHTTLIHIFDGDEIESDTVLHIRGEKKWEVHRWRNLVLGSATYLGLCLVTWCAICTDEVLVCTHGTPIADMLERSPPLPLVIDYFNLH